MTTATTECAACGTPFPRREKAAEVRVRLDLKAGASFALSGQICGKCAARAAAQPEAALEVLRAAARGVLVDKA